MFTFMTLIQNSWGGGKCRQLYLNNNKIFKMQKKKNSTERPTQSNQTIRSKRHPDWKRRSETIALTSVAQWAGCHPAKRKVTNLIPSQGTCLSCGFHPLARHHGRGNQSMFLSLSFSLLFSLKINK